MTSSGSPADSGHVGPSLVQQRAALEAATAKRITDLLAEDTENHNRTADRHVAILSELKALGWKRPRAAKGEAAA